MKSSTYGESLVFGEMSSSMRVTGSPPDEVISVAPSLPLPPQRERVGVAPSVPLPPQRERVAEGRVRVSEVSSATVNTHLDHAREMRRFSTPAERRVWSWIRDRRMLGLKFRRQHIVGPYIVD